MRILTPLRKPLTYLDYYWRAYRLIRKDPADVYHAHDLNTLPVAARLARSTGGRLVYDAHELFPEISTLSKREQTIWSAIERFCIRRADLVITVCDSIANALVERYRVHRPLVVLNCPTPKAALPKSEASDRLRELVGVADSDPIVLYQGGFAPNRGLESLVRSAVHLDEGVVVLMGEGRKKDDLDALVEELGLQEKVFVTDPVPPGELHAYTSGADIGVIPYEPVGLNNYFTTPNKLFEYMAAGLPVVASRLPELIRFVEGLGIGRTFDPGNPREIAAAVGEVWSDQDAYRTMATAARAAHDRYNWSLEAAKLRSRYPGRPSDHQPGATRAGPALTEPDAGDERHASILFVAGGAEVMQHVFGRHRIGYWSAAFDVILEKHGWLDFDRAGFEVLEDPDALARYDALILAWIPDQFWRQSYLRGLREYEGFILAEGPFPSAELERIVGIKQTTARETLDSGPLRLGPEAARYAQQKLRHLIDPGETALQVRPKRVVTSSLGLARQQFRVSADDSRDGLATKVAASYALAYLTRIDDGRAIFDTPIQSALGLLAAAQFVERLPAGPTRDRYTRTLTSFAVPDSDSPGDDHSLVDVAHAALRQASAKGAGDERGPEAEANAESPIEELPPKGPEARLALLLSAIQATAAEERRLELRHLDWLATAGDAVDRSSPALPGELEGWHVGELLLLAATFQRWGRTGVADALWERCIALLDFETTTLRDARVIDGDLQPGATHTTAPTVPLALLALVDEIELDDPGERARTGYDPDQVDAWAATPFWLTPSQPAGSRLEVGLESEGDVLPLLLRQDRTLSSSFQILAYLVHAHTMHPLREPLTGNDQRHVTVLEHILFHLLERGMAECSRLALRVSPWPWGTSRCLTIRHDVDRLPSEQVLRRWLEFETQLGLGVTWFWLPDQLDVGQIRQIVASGHEIGLHALKIDNKAAELRQVREATGSTDSVHGEALHGGRAGDYWLGHPTVQRAREAGLLYTELVPTILDLPYAGFPALEPDGTVSREQIIGVTHNFSPDPSTQEVTIHPGEAPSDASLSPHLEAGFYGQILSHPDMNYDRLKEWVGSLPRADRRDWTCDDVAKWWSATHRREALSIARLAEPTALAVFELTSETDVRDLELHLSCRPDSIESIRRQSAGSARLEWGPTSDPPGVRVRLDLEAGVPVRIHVEGSDRAREPIAAPT